MQHYVRGLHNRMCCCQQFEYAYWIPIPRGHFRVSATDDRRWDDSRHDSPGEKRWRHGCVGYGTLDGSCHWACHRWLSIAGQGLEVDILVNYHRGMYCF